MVMTKKIQLGDKVKDAVTGFTGIAVAKTEWLNGCFRFTVQADKLDKEGKVLDGQCFDEPQLILVKANVVRSGNREYEGPKSRAIKSGQPKPGGPKPAATQHKAPTR
jgi:hypothetical protein